MPDGWEAGEEEKDSKESDDDEETGESLDWTIVLTDQSGQTASLPLSHDSVLYPQINALPRRASFLDSSEQTEVLFRRFEFPFADFAATNAEFDANAIEQISFVFDGSEKGAIIIDDLSVTNAN